MSATLSERLSRLRIAIACEPGPDTSNLVRQLQRSRATVRQMWPVPDRIGADTDLVVCDYMRGLATRLAWPPGEAEAALLVVLPANGQYAMNELQGASPDSILHRPVSLHALDTSVMLALDHFGYIRRLRTRIARVEENVRAIRTIEKAKQTLMSLHRIDEDEAFHMLRDMAMQKRVTIASLASHLVDSADILTYRK
jgi:AmiR/NasT family two-component response regulator